MIDAAAASFAEPAMCPCGARGRPLEAFEWAACGKAGGRHRHRDRKCRSRLLLTRGAVTGIGAQPHCRDCVAGFATLAAAGEGVHSRISLVVIAERLAYPCALSAARTSVIDRSSKTVQAIAATPSFSRGRRMQYFGYLSDDDISYVYEASLEVLEEAGLLVRSEKAAGAVCWAWMRGRQRNGNRQAAAQCGGGVPQAGAADHHPSRPRP